jgi:hypothetical protein
VFAPEEAAFVFDGDDTVCGEGLDLAVELVELFFAVDELREAMRRSGAARWRAALGWAMTCALGQAAARAAAPPAWSR